MIDELKQWEYDRGYEKGKTEVLDKIRAEIPTLSHYQSNDGQDLVMVADVLECIDKYREVDE